MLSTVVADINIEPNTTRLLCNGTGSNMSVKGFVEPLSAMIWVHVNALYPPQLGVAPGDGISAQLQNLNCHSQVTVGTA